MTETATPPPGSEPTPAAPPEDGSPARGPSPGSPLAALGLAMAGAAPVLMLVAGLLWGLSIGDMAPIFIGTAAVALAGAYLVRRPGTWPKVVGIVAAVLVAMMLFWTAFGLFTPQSFFDFVPGLLVIPGALIAIVSCIRALLAGRRTAASEAPVRRGSRAARIVVAVVGALALLSGILTFAAASGGPDGEPAVVASDFEFEPKTLEASAGETIVVSNDDPFGHTFTVDELDIDEALAPGASVEVEIPDEPGDYIFYCMPHTSSPEDPSEDDMAGDLTIR